MLTFWKAEGVPQWIVLVISVVPSLWTRKINIYSSAEYLGVGIMAVCFPCAFHLGLNSRNGVGLRWLRGKGRTQILSSSAHFQHLCIKGFCKAVEFKIARLCDNPDAPHTYPHPHITYFGCFINMNFLGQLGFQSRVSSRLSGRPEGEKYPIFTSGETEVQRDRHTLTHSRSYFPFFEHFCSSLGEVAEEATLSSFPITLIPQLRP